MAGRFLTWFLLLGLVGGLAYLFVRRAKETRAPEASAKIVRVKVQKPAVRDLPIRLTYPAELQAIQAIDIRPVEAKGFVRRITVDKGDKVRKGQLLVVVDCPEYHERKRQALERIRSAKAIYDNAKLTLGRLKPMLAQNFVSPIEVDNAQAAFDSSAANLKNAEAYLSEVNHLLEYCEIRAPFRGEVAMRYVDPGHQVRPGGRPLLSLNRRDAMRVHLNVVERDAVHIREGLPAELTVQGLPGETFHGRVTRFVRSVDPRTRTLLVEIEIPNPDSVLQPGMFGRVSLVVDRHARAILIPAAALLATDNGTFTFVVRDGRVRRVPVKTGYDTGEEVEVLQGLRGNEAVVVVGRDLINDGAAVEVVE
jgi:RND family efflux transporter MFP subunit